MAFFSNKTINYLNLHLALVNVLDQSYWVFSPLYFFERGFSIPAIFLLLTLLNFMRMPMRFLSVPLVHRFGLKIPTMLGAAIYGLSFLILIKVKGWDGWLLFYAIVFSFGNSMHWLCFHAYYSLAGDPQKRGRQVAIAQTLTVALSALAPLFGAFIIADVGFTPYFLMSVPVVIATLLTLSRCQNIRVKPIHWQEGKKAIGALSPKLHLMESCAAYPLNVGWMFVIYLYMGKITSLGDIIAFGMVVQMLYQLLLGALVDRGRAGIIVNISESLRGLSVMAKALIPLSLPTIMATVTLESIANVHHAAIFPTALYNSTKHTPYPLWCWMLTEMAWDTGTIVGAGGTALLMYSGMELRHVILIALPFISILWWLLHRYFMGHPYVQTIAGE